VIDDLLAYHRMHNGKRLPVFEHLSGDLHLNVKMRGDVQKGQHYSDP
jgi:hypothetical protein